MPTFLPPAWRVALLYSALTLLLTYPVSMEPGRTMLGDNPDDHFFLWTLGWDAHAFLNQPLSIFDANIYHPNRYTLAYSENLIGSAFIAAPVIWITGNYVLAFNVVMLVSCMLCGLGTFVLLRKLGVGVAGATLGGLAFAFAPARFFRLSQPHLNAVQWIPFTLAYLHAYLDGGRARDLRLAVLFFSLQTLASGHGAAFVAIAAASLLAFRVALGEPVAFGKRLRDFGIVGAITTLPAALIYFPYRWVQSELAIQRPLDMGTPSAESYLASPTTLHTYLHSFVRDGTHINETAHAFLFPGYVAIALALIGLVWYRRPGPAWRTDARIVYGLLTILAVTLTMPPPNGLWPYVYRWPIFSLIRVQSRFIILAVLGLAVLAGLGFDRLFKNRPKWETFLAGTALGLLMVVESSAIPLKTYPFEVPTTGLERWLDQQPKPFVVAELPFAQRARFQTIYIMHSMTHWQKTVQGYSSNQAPLHSELFELMRYLPDEKSLNRLADLGVTYLVVHRKMYPDDVWAEIAGYLKDWGAWLTLVYEENEERVYRLQRPAQP